MDELNIANGQPADSPVERTFLSAQETAEDRPTGETAPTEQTGMPGPPAAEETFATPAPVEPPPGASLPPAISEGLPPAISEGLPPAMSEGLPPAISEAEAAPVEEPKEEPKSDKMDWYILKVQSNREESIREGLLRRVAIAGLGYFFGEVIVPTEKVTEFKGGKKRVVKRKLYPGYLVVHMEINDDTWFLVRETPGIGDFTGAAGHPSPMLPHEVQRIVAKQEEKSEKAPKLKIAFREGERVKIKEGTFENFEGEVDAIDETNGRVTVMINIFGRFDAGRVGVLANRGFVEGGI